MLTLYRIVAWLLAPLVLRRVQRTDEPELKARRKERLGRITPSRTGLIWVHAASVGEINAIQGLIEGLLKRPGSPRLLLSTFTLTGAERAQALFGERVDHCLAPLDTRGSVKRWLESHRPSLALIAETEIWPELYYQAGRQQLPIILVNARLTERSLRRARRFGKLFERSLQSVSLALCQSEPDAERLKKLGLDSGRTEVTGSLKFDISLPEAIGPMARAFREQWGPRPCWVAGSTRPGEEDILLAAHQQLRAERPDALLVIAPRHPERADEVVQLIQARGLAWQVVGEDIDAHTAVVLVNRIGVLMPCYAAAAVSFVGGSLVDLGGHNLLEPATIGKAVLAGPHLHHQSEAAQALKAADALITIESAEQLAETISGLWQNPERALALGSKAMGVVERGRGSLRRTLKLLEKQVPQTAA